MDSALLQAVAGFLEVAQQPRHLSQQGLVSLQKTLLKQCSLGDTENVLGLEYTYQHMTNIWSLGAV